MLVPALGGRHPVDALSGTLMIADPAENLVYDVRGALGVAPRAEHAMDLAVNGLAKRGKRIVVLLQAGVVTDQ